MGEYDGLEEINLTTSIKSKYPKRTKAGISRGLNALEHANKRPKWKKQLSAKRAWDNRK